MISGMNRYRLRFNKERSLLSGSVLPYVIYYRQLYAQPVSVHNRTQPVVGGRLMAGQRQDTLVDCVEYPLSLREEGVFQFGSRGDPVAKA